MSFEEPDKEELNQDNYYIMVHKDFSIKIGKISNDLSRPELKRSTNAIHYTIMSVADFSCLFQKLNQQNSVDNYPQIFSSIPIHDNEKITSTNNEEPSILNSLLPILVNNSEDHNDEDDDSFPFKKEELDKIKHLIVPPKLTRQREVSSIIWQKEKEEINHEFV
jgi:hypothetical protein